MIVMRIFLLFLAIAELAWSQSSTMVSLGQLIGSASPVPPLNKLSPEERAYRDMVAQKNRQFINKMNNRNVAQSAQSSKTFTTTSTTSFYTNNNDVATSRITPPPSIMPMGEPGGYSFSTSSVTTTLPDPGTPAQTRPPKYLLGQNQFIYLTPEQFARKYNVLIVSTPEVRRFLKNKEELQSINNNNCTCDPNVQRRKNELELTVSAGASYLSKFLSSKTVGAQETSSTAKSSAQNLNQATFTEPSIPIGQSYDPFTPIGATFPQPRPFLRSTLPVPILKSSSSSSTSSSSSETITVQSSTSTSSPTPPKKPSTMTNINKTAIDWSSLTGPVRHQGACGSCYVITTIQVVEFSYRVNMTGVFIPLSLQQVVDCLYDGMGVDGCNGGILEQVYSYLVDNGVTSEFRYPYTSNQTGKSGKCKTKVGQYRVKTWMSLDSGSCKELRDELSIKPISVGIQGKRLQFYKTGVFDDCQPDQDVDHAVLIVGYDNQKGWKFKNTWGTGWGEEGYGWLSLEQEKNCQLCKYAAIPTVIPQFGTAKTA